jgi:hypothetical protein
MKKKKSTECIHEIHNKTNNEFNILLTAKKVFIKNVSQRINNRVNSPRNISIIEINEK